jgi:hypothetical protein
MTAVKCAKLYYKSSAEWVNPGNLSCAVRPIPTTLESAATPAASKTVFKGTPSCVA